MYANLNDRLADILRDLYNDNTWEPEDEMAEIEAALTERVADLTANLNPADTMAAYEEAAHLLSDLASSPIGWAR